MERNVTPGEYIIDSRDIIEVYEEIQQEIIDKQEEIDELRAKDCALNEEDLDELKALQEEIQPYADLINEGQHVPDWEYGATLILDSEFEDYAYDLAHDCYKIHDYWPYTCIDWEQAARELEMDYSSIEFGEETYLVRS